jgi:hypothetical protein
MQVKATLWVFSPSCGGKDKHQERNNKKNAKMQYWKDRMLIKTKGYAKLLEDQFKKHMEYDDMNETPLGNVHS